MSPNAKSVTVVLVLCLAVGLSVDLVAQSVPMQIDAGNLTGIMPYNTYGGVRENINLSTGNLNLQIPVLSLPGRNGLDLQLGFVYDSKIWSPRDNLTDCCLSYSWETEKPSGMRLNLPTLVATWVKGTLHPNGTIYCAENLIVILSDGSKHSFYQVKTACIIYPDGGGGPNPYPSGYSNNLSDSKDAAFLTLDTVNASDVIVYTKSGHRLHFTIPPRGLSLDVATQVTKIEDTNGNMNTFSYGSPFTITDSLNRVVAITSTQSSSTLTYKDSNGATQSITWASANFPGPTPTFALPVPNGLGQHSVGGVTSITLPTGRTYTFQYNNYGELIEITYPEGGYTRYDYKAFTAYHSFNSGPTAVDFREVVAKHVCRDAAGACTVTPPPNPTCVTNASEDTTCYTPTIDSSKGNNQYLDALDPLQNLTHYQFAYCGAQPPLCTTYFSPRELVRNIYQGTSTPLRAIATDYSNNDPGRNDALPIHKTTTLQDVTPNLVTKTEWDYDTYTRPAEW